MRLRLEHCLCQERRGNSQGCGERREVPEGVRHSPGSRFDGETKLQQSLVSHSCNRDCDVGNVFGCSEGTSKLLQAVFRLLLHGCDRLCEANLSVCDGLASSLQITQGLTVADLEEVGCLIGCIELLFHFLHLAVSDAFDKFEVLVKAADRGLLAVQVLFVAHKLALQTVLAFRAERDMVSELLDLPVLLLQQELVPVLLRVQLPLQPGRLELRRVLHGLQLAHK
mmetsp:Transcript_22994/g.53722  ORF Transcript_22994/g.53722 Transcript_22994/m.53722 type:complete len:225 (-) Transcript_22994:5303-5977(-)